MEDYRSILKRKRESLGLSQHRLAKQLGISDILEKFPYQVSGGQKQRAACAPIQ